MNFSTLIHAKALAIASQACIVSKTASIDFAKLCGFVRATAKALQQREVQRGSRVAILSESSPAAIILLLAALDLGAVVVPLASSLPASRIESISGICKLTHLIPLSTLPQPISLPDVCILNIDLKKEVFCVTAYEGLLSEDLDPSAPAVVLFTSGSTGKPKGVVHSHESLHTMATAVSDSLCLRPGERNLLFPSFGWAVNIIDSLASLAGGACLCIPTEAEKSQGLEDAIETFQATSITVPSSILRIIDPDKVQSLTRLIVAGEPLTPDLAKVWLPRVAVYWNYGSSETLMVLLGCIKSHLGNSINAGKPLACVECYVVDGNGQKLPPGQTGQIVIQSKTNSIGYIQKGELEEAVPNSEGNLTFQPGDLFEVHPNDGTLIYHGRADFQLKLFGQRFEPQEVEFHLRPALPNVAELVVTLAWLDGSAVGPTLVAVVVLKDCEDCAVVTSTGKRRLKCDYAQIIQHLPPFMVPAGAFLVEALPRLHNGKVDRKSIVHVAERCNISDLWDIRPEVTVAKDSDQNRHVELMKSVAIIWAEVLGVQDYTSITASSNFFLLGGSSLDAMRACKELSRIGIRLSISNIFAGPTLGETIDSITRTRLTLLRSNTRPSLEQDMQIQNRMLDTDLCRMAAQQCGVTPDAIEDIYPCTAMQIGLLSNSGSSLYTMSRVFRLPKQWSHPRFADAWSRVLETTPVLRTHVVKYEDGRLFNAIVRLDVALAHLASGIPRSSTFTIGCPLFWYRVEEDNASGCSMWHWRIHHAICDRWSTTLILNKLTREYMGQSHTCRVTFSQVSSILKMQETSENARNFWRSELQSFAGKIFPHVPIVHSTCKASQLHEFDCITPRHMSATTQATSIQAATALMISKMQGESDIVFGMTTHGRDLLDCPDADMIIGPVITTIPVRIKVEGSCTVRTFLERIQNKTASFLDYQHHGLQKIRSLGQGPASATSFATLLIVQPDLSALTRTGPEAVVEVDPGTELALDYPLVIECMTNDSGITVKMMYDAAVLSSWEIEKMGNIFHHAFKKFETFTELSSRIGHLRLTSTTCETEILKISSGEMTTIDDCLDKRILKKALHWMDNEALNGWDGHYTYAQLKQIVFGAAKLLQVRLSLGAAPGMIIPILYDKSAAAVVGMLSVLSAGYGFLIIDPNLPVQRIKHMLYVVKANSILHSLNTAAMARKFELSEVNFEEILDQIREGTETVMIECGRERSPEAPAYCLFTSGSTGSPKAVLFLHKQVTSGLEAQCKAGIYPRMSRLFQFASYSFDTSIADIFATLLSGGCVCIPKDDSRLTHLAESIKQFSADVVDLTPSVARLLTPKDTPGLKTLRLGGEPIQKQNIRTWADHCNLQNTYGPTECCVQCTWISSVDRSMCTSNIGKAIGCNTWVVDLHNPQILAPLGAVGELAVQGPGVASGYLEDTNKSARFLTCPPWLNNYNIECEFATYLTGDLVRFDQNGDLHFMGRRDGQMQVRGQRVEPGEIEHVLQESLFVDQAIVCFPENGILESQLVAILKPCYRQFNAACLPENKTWWMMKATENLHDFLPNYMIPSAYLSSEIPLTASGKLDRKNAQRWLEKITAEELGTMSVYRLRDNFATSLSSLATPPAALTARIVEQIQWLLSQQDGNTRRDISLFHSFTEIGFDSITLVPFQKWINNHYGTKVGMRALLKLENVHALVCHLHGIVCDGIQNRANLSDMIADGLDRLLDCFEDTASTSEIDHDTVHQHGRENLSNFPTRVLLTGGSSLIGLSILVELLHHSKSTQLVVLLRCADATVGKQKLLGKLVLMSTWRQEFADRVEIWPGDLGLPLLGLSSRHRLQLTGNSSPSTNIDAIVHSGALVDWVQSFEKLKTVNIEATLDLVKCAKSSASMQRLIYISGGLQWDPHEEGGNALESSRLEQSFSNSNAYGQTKLIASTIIQKAAGSDPIIAQKVAVVRPGLVIGSSMDGIPNIDDYIWRVVIGCWRIGCFPRESADSWVYMCGADCFAKIVLETFSAAPQIFESRVERGIPIDRFWDVINQELGGQLECVEYEMWLDRLQQDTGVNNTDAPGSHPCLPVMYMIESSPAVLGAVAPTMPDSEWHEVTVKEVSFALRMNIRVMRDTGCFSSTHLEGPARTFTRNKNETGLLKRD